MYCSRQFYSNMYGLGGQTTSEVVFWPQNWTPRPKERYSRYPYCIQAESTASRLNGLRGRFWPQNWTPRPRKPMDGYPYCHIMRLGSPTRTRSLMTSTVYDQFDLQNLRPLRWSWRCMKTNNDTCEFRARTYFFDPICQSNSLFSDSISRH